MDELSMAARTLLTYEDYAALPHDGKRYELHEGELWLMGSPSVRHQLIIGNLYSILRAYVLTVPGRGQVLLSPLDCIMSEITVLQPDVIYLDDDRRRLLSERAVEGAPTLAVEIPSPWSRRNDLRLKMRLYAKHGVDWYWVVDGDARTIDAYRLDAGAYRVDARLAGTAPHALPPFADLPLDPAAIWA